MRRFAYAAAILAATAIAPAARAQATDPVAAATLFQEGREAARRGDYASACPKLAESLRLDPAPGTLLNLADCEEHLGKLASAWQHFRLATERLPPGDDRAPLAKQRADALEPRLPRLTVVLARSAPPRTVVSRDAVEIGPGALGTALPVDPGDHVVEVTSPDRSPRRFAVSLREREAKTLEVEPGPPAATPPGGAAPPARPSEPQPSPAVPAMRIAGFVVGGVGLAGLGAAIATGLVLPGKRATADANCGPNKDRCNDVGYDAAQAGKTLVVVNTATWIAGGIATALGVTLVAVSFRKPSAPASARVTAWPGGAGVSLDGRF